MDIYQETDPIRQEEFTELISGFLDKRKKTQRTDMEEVFAIFEMYKEIKKENDMLGAEKSRKYFNQIKESNAMAIIADDQYEKGVLTKKERDLLLGQAMILLACSENLRSAIHNAEMTLRRPLGWR